MDPQTHLQQGDLDAALAAVKQQVRDEPANAKHRIFLFQLFAVMGDWSRALTQLNVSGELDPAALAMVQTYREALSCEALREEVFAGNRTPLVFGEAEQWIALALQAVKLVAEEQFERAAELRNEAYEAVPTVPGSVNGEAFEWVADADTRIGPFLEAVVNGHYYWIPLHRIALLEVEPPADLRDLVWLPGHFTWTNGGQAVGLIPSRYPGSQGTGDHSLMLSRSTEWQEKPADTFLGVGQRMLATDAGEYSFLELRELKFDSGGETQETS